VCEPAKDDVSVRAFDRLDFPRFSLITQWGVTVEDDYKLMLLTLVGERCPQLLVAIMQAFLELDRDRTGEVPG